MKMQQVEQFGWRTTPCIWFVVVIVVASNAWTNSSSVSATNALILLVTLTLFTLYAAIDSLKKENADQQTQITDLKRELEEAMTRVIRENVQPQEPEKEE